MARGASPRALRSRAAFTLIEVLAVTAIFALLAGIALPNFQITRDRATLAEAKRLAADAEFARTRAVATAVPHRLVIDLDGAGYRVEWRPRPEPAGEEEGPAGARTAPPDPFGPPGDGPILMAPPRDDALEFQPLPGRRDEWLPDEVHFAHVETGGLETREGRVEIEFARDGSTAEPATIVLADASGSRFALDLTPLADAVRIRRVER